MNLTFETAPFYSKDDGLLSLPVKSNIHCESAVFLRSKAHDAFLLPDIAARVN